MLSKIERGQLFPTLPTLVRIAMVFGVGLDHFFSPEKDRPLVAVVRKAERIRLSVPAGDGPPAWLFESLDYPVADRRMEAYYAEFPADAPVGSAPHGSAEFITCGRRLLVYVDGGKRASCRRRDYFESSVPHSNAVKAPSPARPWW